MIAELAEHEFPRATEVINKCIQDLLKLKSFTEDKNFSVISKGYRISINERLKELE